jgi:hypothetical protein
MAKFFVTTGTGIKIGLAHTPKPRRLSADEERIQAILLNSYPPLTRTEKITRVVYLVALVVIALDMMYWRPN